VRPPRGEELHVPFSEVDIQSQPLRASDGHRSGLPVCPLEGDRRSVADHFDAARPLEDVPVGTDNEHIPDIHLDGQREQSVDVDRRALLGTKRGD